MMKNVVIVGGGGHIGLPLGIVLSKLGHSVVALDINQDAVDKINRGVMPFYEDHAEALLKEVILGGGFRASTEMSELKSAHVIIICIGTPVDEHMSPVPRIFIDLLASLKEYFQNGQLLILRSTVYPGTTRLAAKYLQGFDLEIAFCPERILQGKAIEELGSMPNIISGVTSKAAESAKEFLSGLGPTISATVEEAEFAKLFLNTYRYIEFATSNQLYTIANDAGVDYSRVLEVMKFEYPRASKLPGPGFTAGPCLMKDTMQLVSFSQNRFTLGSSAFFANEGLALYVVDQVMKLSDSKEPKIGLLGMAFKADNDDIRASLSYRVRKAFQLAGADVIAGDNNVSNDSTLIPEQTVIELSDIIVICAPHKQYKEMDFRGKQVIDIWNMLGHGSLIAGNHVKY